MINRATKLRWRRRFRRQRQQVEEVSVQAEEQLERHVFKRLSRLARVRRFMVSWILLLCLLIVGSVIQFRALSQHYQRAEAAPGGTFTEGIVGMFTGANPLYATSAVDSAVSRLVFSGLMKYDKDNRLVGDLAEAISVDERGLRYEIRLRPNVRWHDGRPLTAKDVAFTYQLIQNPDARSPLFGGWKGVKIEAPNDRTVVFTLPIQLGSFPHSLTTGIVPQHLLGDIPAAQLRSSRFNTVSPIGTGPFKWGSVEVAGTSQQTREELIGLSKNESFYSSSVRLDQFIIRAFRDEKLMVQSFEQGQLDAMVGLTELSDELDVMSGAQDFNVPLTGEVMVFFNNSEPPFNDVNVRRALVHSVNTSEAIATLGYPVIVARGPLIMSHPGYNKLFTQLPFDKAEAEKILEEAGWRKGRDGIRQKDGQRLSFTLQAQNVSDYRAISQYLSKNWRTIGVQAEVLLQPESDIQGIVSRHDYQALLYGISLGPDPDVFAYWHSSQAARGSAWLNLSEYKSTVVDDALEEGRTRSDPAVRSAKYHPFLEAWRSDAPALALYQPRFLYVVRGNLFNFDPAVLNSPTDRFSNVEEWMVRETKVLR
jgi:peptide/nickel transport system substrate-binding protein